MGWGENGGVSHRLVLKSEFERTARVLASAVESHKRFPTTGQYESMLDALADFRRAEEALR